MFPTLLSAQFLLLVLLQLQCFYLLLLTVGTSQIINKMIAMTSTIQRSGPAKKPIEKPSSHKINRIAPMIKSKVSILTSFL